MLNWRHVPPKIKEQTQTEKELEELLEQKNWDYKLLDTDYEHIKDSYTNTPAKIHGNNKPYKINDSRKFLDWAFYTEEIINTASSEFETENNVTGTIYAVDGYRPTQLEETDYLNGTKLPKLATMSIIDLEETQSVEISYKEVHPQKLLDQETTEKDENTINQFLTPP